MNRSVIVAVESPHFARSIVQELRRRGIQCCEANGLSSFLHLALVHPTGAVVIDAVYHGRSGLDLVRAQRTLPPDTPVILHSDRSSLRLEAAVTGLKRGAMDVLLAPFEADAFTKIAEACHHGGMPVAGRSTTVEKNGQGPAVAAERFENGESQQLAAGPLNGDQQQADAHRMKRWTPLQRQERRLIVEALEQTGGHVVKAARLLRMGQATVYRKIRQYKVPRDNFSKQRADQPQTA
ncbi:MAG: helix-turn-helix domain-containing protein [Aeoliella sp.]